ncbi:MAG: hypothetical protein D6749_08990 [Chloroflexota bacterium]|nr:MAG: hypothetical protein D6749_08990 [Chloroflexota bacterium]
MYSIQRAWHNSLQGCRIGLLAFVARLLESAAVRRAPLRYTVAISARDQRMNPHAENHFHRRR